MIVRNPHKRPIHFALQGAPVTIAPESAAEFICAPGELRAALGPLADLLEITEPAPAAKGGKS